MVITKRTTRKTPKAFGALADYIAGKDQAPETDPVGKPFGETARYLSAPDAAEKRDRLWLVNCAAGETLDDLPLAIKEIEATQSLNTRAKGDKTYHLIVSFRKGERPTQEQLKEMERAYSEALGFEDHQCVAATHQNTENYHVHLAYNKIHPTKHTCVTPSWDFYKLSAVNRRMEKAYGLQVDRGIELSADGERVHDFESVRDFEARTWQQSFESYVKERKKPLLDALEKAQDWQALHEAFAIHCLKLKPRGNGLTIRNATGKDKIKASALDRRFTKARLEERFGRYQKPRKEKPLPAPRIAYEAKPLTKHPATRKLWQRYENGERRAKKSRIKALNATWRDFLKAEAINDPLAMAIIVFHKKAFKMLGLGR